MKAVVLQKINRSEEFKVKKIRIFYQKTKQKKMP